MRALKQAEPLLVTQLQMRGVDAAATEEVEVRALGVRIIVELSGNNCEAVLATTLETDGRTTTVKFKLVLRVESPNTLASNVNT